MEKRKCKIVYVGVKPQVDGSLCACTSAETREQIEELKQYRFPAQVQSDRGTSPPPTLEACIGGFLRFIAGDREMRIDKNIAMADRPPTAVIGVVGKEIVQIDTYAGHDRLHRDRNLRSAEVEYDIPDWSDRWGGIGRV